MEVFSSAAPRPRQSFPRCHSEPTHPEDGPIAKASPPPPRVHKINTQRVNRFKLQNRKLPSAAPKENLLIRRCIYDGASDRVAKRELFEKVKQNLQKFAVKLDNRVPLSREGRNRREVITVLNMNGEEKRFTVSKHTTLLELHQAVRKQFDIPLRATPISIALVYINRRYGLEDIRPNTIMFAGRGLLVPANYKGTTWQLVVHF